MAQTLFREIPANEGTASIHDLKALKPDAWKDLPPTLNINPIGAPIPYAGETTQGHILIQSIDLK